LGLLVVATAISSQKGAVILMTRSRIVQLGAATAVASLAFGLPAMAHQAAARATVVTVIAGRPTEYGFILSRKIVPLGTAIFKLSDAGQLPHSFKVCATALTPVKMKSTKSLTNVCSGTATESISPGGLATLKVVFKTKGVYEYLCTLPGHASSGQKGELTVT
jgi:uncharacterized cupredoxin-like copper-binding protein